MGDHVNLLADIFPASISPAPGGVPTGRKLRILITDQKLVIAWMNGAVGGVADIGSWESPVSALDVSHQGGTVDQYTVKRATGCSCGAAALKSWNPFSGEKVVRNLRGLPSSAPDQVGTARYTRL